MDRKLSLKHVLALVLLTSALTCLVMALLFSWNTDEKSEGFFEYNDLSDFAELLDILSTRFIGTVDINEITDAAKRAAVESLDDRWSYFMSADEYNVYLESSDNRYSGIGVEVEIDEDTKGIKVTNVHRGSGADSAGIVAGDIITAVDGESILGFTFVEVRAALRRPLGDTALLTLLRAGGFYHDLRVLYSTVFVDPVSYEMIYGDIGYVSLRNFDSGAADSFISAVNSLNEQGAVAFIYDVRSNNGGKVTEMTSILDFLLPKGEIFITVTISGEEQIITSDDSSIDKPAVVLVNEFSYSGAEYFTAILSEYEYAQTVGEQTTGKNRMQTTIIMSNGDAVVLSTAEYLTKNRVSLYDTGGFTPDYLIELTDEEFALFRAGNLDFDSDPQLLKAVDLLRN
jgi:carboxyl-terminal processing protease